MKEAIYLQIRRNASSITIFFKHLYRLAFNKSNITDVTSEAGTAYPSGAHEDQDFSIFKLFLQYDLYFYCIYGIRFKIYKYFYHQYFNMYISCKALLLALVFVIVWQLDLQLPVKSVPITTKVVGSIPVYSEVYSIQHYVIKLVTSDRPVVSPGTPVSSTNKADLNNIYC